MEAAGRQHGAGEGAPCSSADNPTVGRFGINSARLTACEIGVVAGTVEPQFHSLWVRYPEARFGLVGGIGWMVECTMGRVLVGGLF